MNAADRKDALAGRFDRITDRAKRADAAKKAAQSRKRERAARAPVAARPKRDPTIRPRVMARAEEQGGCEWCPPHRKSLAFVLEWHHLRGGGERRTAESAENTAGVCWDCHRGWERGSMDVLRAAKEWAIRLGFRDALHRVERKIAKVEEARSVPSVPVRIEVRS
jgi:hypothetical protein